MFIKKIFYIGLSWKLFLGNVIFTAMFIALLLYKFSDKTVHQAMEISMNGYPDPVVVMQIDESLDLNNAYRQVVERKDLEILNISSTANMDNFILSKVRSHYYSFP